MQKLTYYKKDGSYHYKRVIGCGVNPDNDCEEYLLESDGSRLSTDDLSAAKILLFSRLMAASKMNRYSIKQIIHYYLCKFANWVLFS